MLQALQLVVFGDALIFGGDFLPLKKDLLSKITAK